MEMNNSVGMNHCAEMNSQTNWLSDKNLVGCSILRIVEFDLKMLDLQYHFDEN